MRAWFGIFMLCIWWCVSANPTECMWGFLYSSNSDADADTAVQFSGLSDICLCDVRSNASLAVSCVTQWLKESPTMLSILLPAGDYIDLAFIQKHANVTFVQPWPTTLEFAPNLIRLATPTAFYFREILALLESRYSMIAIVNPMSSVACDTVHRSLALTYNFNAVLVNASELNTMSERPDIVLLCAPDACSLTQQLFATWAPEVVAVYPGNCTGAPLVLSGIVADLRSLAFSVMQRLAITEQTWQVNTALLPERTPPLILNAYNENEWQPQRWDQASVGSLTPPASGLSLRKLVTPALATNDRNYRQTMFAFPEEQVFASLVALYITGCCMLILFLCRYREHTVIRSMGLSFSLYCIVGCALAGFSILTWPVENDTYTCKFRIPLMSFAFMLIIYPLSAKTVRVGDIFSNKLRPTPHNYVIKDRTVLLRAMLWALPQCITTIVCVALYPLQASVQIVDPFRLGLAYTDCVSTNSTAVLACLVFCGVALVLALYAAVHARDAYSLFNDAGVLVFVVYNFAFTFAFLLLVHSIWTDLSSLAARRLLFIIRSATLLFCLCMTCIILFGKRVIQAYTVASTVMRAELERESDALIRSPRTSRMFARSGPPSPPEGTTPGSATARSGFTATTTTASTVSSPMLPPSNTIATRLHRHMVPHSALLTIPTTEEAKAFHKQKHRRNRSGVSHVSSEAPIPHLVLPMETDSQR